MRGGIIQGSAHPGDLEIGADVAIIGSGAAGAVAAAYLAEAGQSVVVLEEGGHHTPAQYGRYRPSQQIREMWRDSGMTMTFPVGDSPSIQVMMGRCVGGSSLLTGGVCFRTPERVLEHWRRVHGLEDLSPQAMEEVFEEVERVCHIEEVPVHMRSRSTQLFDEGATALGHPLKSVRRNTLGCDGCGRCNFGCPHGAKLSVDLTYLPRAVQAGAQVYSDCLVERIEVKDGRAVGVVGRVLNAPNGRRGGRLRVRARRVILAAGAWHSPILLKKSGVGRDSEQVGRNLTLHPGVRVMGLFDSRVEGWRGAMQSAYSDAYEDQGFTLMSLFTPPGVVAATMPGIGQEHLENTRNVPHVAIFGGMVHDSGGGIVRRAIGREPFVSYGLTAEDRGVMNRMITTLAQTFFAAGARKVILPVLGQDPMTADQFRSFPLEHVSARSFECSSQHPLGTCRMGVNPGSSVVDPDGQTWEVKELFVVDSGVLPTSLGVNPQQSVMAMATRLAWKLAERKLPVQASAA
jgi:choline dehydrogenase-like flavoprotein